MPHNLTGLDHTLIGVADLEQSRTNFEKLGFTLTPRGSHIGWGTANYCIMFDDDYIELLGVVDPNKETNGLDQKLVDRGEGMLGFALATDDPEQTVASLNQSDLGPAKLYDLKRKLELPEGDVIPEFKLVRFPIEGLPVGGMFICHHLTPELIRAPEWGQHANGVQYVQSIVVLVDDPKAHKDHYTKLCGSINVTVTDATVTVRIGKLNVIFVAEPDIDLLFPGLVFGAEWPAFPHILSMTLAVENLSATENCLTENGVQTQKIANGSIRIQPKDANGVLLEFSKA
jgi:catechol 2,3-dioxygenase-like lactoylglutathione lyase family enzyme